MGAGPLNQYTMASLLGSYIEVENPILQVLLNALLFSLIGALFTTDFKKLRKSIFEYLNLSKYWRRFWKDPTRPTMKFQGSCRQSSSNMHCVPELSAWLHHIQQLIEKIPEGGNVSFSEFELLHLQMQAIDHLMPANNQEFDVGDDIRCEFTTKQVTEQRNMKNQGMIEVELESFSLIISTTPERGLHHLLARTKEVVEKYNAYKSKKLTESPCLFVYQGGPAEKTSSWKKEKFSSTRKVEHIWIEEQHKFFAHVLVDPSCSGSGMKTRRIADKTADLKRLESLSRFQVKILNHALSFPNVRQVVYSTCSIHEIENEAVVKQVLEFNPAFKIRLALPSWPRRGLNKHEFGSLCVRTDSKFDKTNGFFVCLFEKS